MHNWVQGLDIIGEVFDFMQEAMAGQQRGLAPAVPERVLIDIQLACLDLVWCGPKTDPVIKWDCWLPIHGGHTVVILTALTQRASDDIHDPTPVLDWLLEVLNELFLDDKHSSLAYQLLDMYLLAMATLDIQAMPNRVVVYFPKDLVSMRQDIFRPLGLAGVSPTLFHSVIQALQRFSWASFEQKIFYCDIKAYSVSMPILDWYLSRTPPHLRMLHNWCHELASFVRKDYLFPQDAVIPYFVEHLPFDLLDVVAPANHQRALQHCPRCNQLRLVGQQSHDAGLRAFVDTSDDRLTPMSFLPTPLADQRKLARDVQTWLCATPPSTGSYGPQKRTPFTWRAYLMGFWRQNFSYMIHWFWPHTPDSVLGPRKDRLLVVPFEDLMFVMLKSHQFGHALEVLKEARALVVGENPFLTWRYVAAKHESVSAIAAREERFGLARVKQVLDEFWEFMEYVEKNGLVVRMAVK